MKERSLGSDAFPPLPHPGVPSHGGKETAATALKDTGGLMLNNPWEPPEPEEFMEGQQWDLCNPACWPSQGCAGSRLSCSQDHAAQPPWRTPRDLLQPSLPSGALSKHQEHCPPRANSNSHCNFCIGFQKPWHLTAEPEWPSRLCCQDETTDRSHLSVHCLPSQCYAR